MGQNGGHCILVNYLQEPINLRYVSKHVHEVFITHTGRYVLKFSGLYRLSDSFSRQHSSYIFTGYQWICNY
jgi:hypothetical protein